MTNPRNQNKSVLVFPEVLSESNSEKFMKELRRLLDENRNRSSIIDCTHISEINQAQLILLNKIADLCKNVNIRVKFKPGMTGIPRSLNDICKITYSPISNFSNKQFNKLENSTIDYEDEFFPTNSDKENAIKRLKEFLDTFYFISKSKYIIKTIFYEFTSNIQLHSSMNKKDKISFKMQMINSDVHLTFIDSGVVFDVSEQPNGPCVSAIYEIERLSFGIQMIHTLSDGIKYTRTNDSKNVTTLTIKGIIMSIFPILKDALDEGLLVIQLDSTLDNSNIHQLAEMLTKANEDGYKQVVIDCSKLEFVSSAGIGVIVSRNRLFNSVDKELVLFDVPEVVMFVLNELDVADLLTIKSDLHTTIPIG